MGKIHNDVGIVCCSLQQAVCIECDGDVLARVRIDAAQRWVFRQPTGIRQVEADCHVVVNVCSVEYRLQCHGARGILKASFREVDESKSGPGQPFHPFERQDLLEAGKVYEFQIELTPICYTFKTGHRLQVQIASEDIEYNSIHRQVDVMILPWPVENTVHHDAAHPSHLLLPVIPDAPEIKPVSAPVADINWPMPPGSWLPNTDGWPLTGD